MEKGGFTYILTNKSHTVLYVGVTSDLSRRIQQHKSFAIPGFVSTYRCCKLVYYERFECIEDAIQREKQLKGKTRKKKIDLINSTNMKWQDLATGLS